MPFDHRSSESEFFDSPSQLSGGCSRIGHRQIRERGEPVRVRVNGVREFVREPLAKWDPRSAGRISGEGTVCNRTCISILRLHPYRLCAADRVPTD